MTRTSAGIVLWRRHVGELEVLLAHPGGPLFATRDMGHWGVPKGEVEPGEDLLAVARREFAEETGHAAPDGPLLELGSIVQKGGKVVHVWAVEGDLDPAAATSNTFPLEWPPRSGQTRAFPEIDRVEWFGLEEASRRIRLAQAPLLERLAAALGPEAVKEPSGTLPPPDRPPPSGPARQGEVVAGAPGGIGTHAGTTPVKSVSQRAI